MKDVRKSFEYYVLNKRRKFLKFLPLVVVGTFSYPASKFVFFSEKKSRNFSIPLRDISEGITKVNKQEFFIYKYDDKIVVYDAHCTHMGCILNFYKSKDKFICPCHHSEFSINGTRIKGPAKRNLDRIKYKMKNKTLYIG